MIHIEFSCLTENRYHILTVDRKMRLSADIFAAKTIQNSKSMLYFSKFLTYFDLVTGHSHITAVCVSVRSTRHMSDSKMCLLDALGPSSYACHTGLTTGGGGVLPRSRYRMPRPISMQPWDTTAHHQGALSAGMGPLGEMIY